MFQIIGTSQGTETTAQIKAVSMHGTNHLETRIYLNFLDEAQKMIYFKCESPRGSVLTFFSVKCKLSIRNFCFKLSGVMIFSRKSHPTLFTLWANVRVCIVCGTLFYVNCNYSDLGTCQTLSCTKWKSVYFKGSNWQCCQWKASFIVLTGCWTLHTPIATVR